MEFRKLCKNKENCLKILVKLKICVYSNLCLILPCFSPFQLSLLGFSTVTFKVLQFRYPIK